MKRACGGCGRIAAVLLAAAVLVVPAMAGCIGGGSGPQDGPAQEGPGDGTGPGEDDGTPQNATAEHVHDRWKAGPDQLSGGATDTITLVDSRTVTIRSFRQDPEDPTSECAGQPQGDGQCWGQKIVTPDPTETGTKIVPPGTGSLTMTFEYDESELTYYNGSGGVHVWYQSRKTRTETSGHWRPAGSDAMPAASGRTVTLENLTLDEEDNGHASSSAWRWRLGIRGNPTPESPVYPNAHFTDPDGVEVTVTIEAHRQPGDLPLEPPHPEFYDEDPDGPTRVYQTGALTGETEGRFVHGAVASGELPDGENYCPTDQTCAPATVFEGGLLWWTQPGFVGARKDDRSQYRPTEAWSRLDTDFAASLVPPKTTLVVAVLRFSDDAASEHGEAEFCLRTRTSAAETSQGEIANEDSACEVYDGQDEIKLTEVITSGQVDSPYADNWGQNASRWTFLIQLRSAGGQSLSPVGTAYQPGTFSGSFSTAFFVTSEAQLDPVPSWATFEP